MRRLPALSRQARRYVTAYTPHGGSFNYKPGGIEHKVYMAIERLLEGATDMFLFESRFIAGRFEAHIGHMPSTDHRIVLNGISEAEFEPIDHDARPTSISSISASCARPRASTR